MTIRQAIWKIGPKPEPLRSATLPSEAALEEMIVAAPSILHDQWMIIGKQVQTGYGGKLDLLAIAPDGALVLIELKRDQTPREVVAQAIDYASFVDTLQPESIAAIYAKFKPDRDLGADFQTRFGLPLDEETLNSSHQIVIVAAAIDDSTARIVRYLNDRDIPINILCFQIFANGAEQLISRAWLLDPTETQLKVTNSESGNKEPWNGEFYASYGHNSGRLWEEARRYGFISAGGGSWYSGSLNLLSEGDRVWVKAPKFGFVGVGLVKGKPVPAGEFMISTPEGDKSALDVLKGDYSSEFADDPERREYFVAVEWRQTLPINEGVQEVGLFGNQNTVCKPTTPKWRHTIDRLKLRFPKFDG